MLAAGTRRINGTNDLCARAGARHSVVLVPHRRRLILASLAVTLLVAVSLAVVHRVVRPEAALLPVPSAAGLNYGMPHDAGGNWVGTEWLRSAYWAETRPALAADLDFMQRHKLGKLQRIFVGLDQTMLWDENRGFTGFDAAALAHFSTALDMFDAHGMKAIVVVYDQEVVGSAGNFHFAALDGKHTAMRQGYLRATEEFFRRLGGRDTVAGWDLFNEAYNSLGTDGRMPQPPHADPVSPGYSDSVVHGWLRDLYHAARLGSASARLTVSDATELYWNPDPDVGKYEDVVDFYDVHVYDDNPRYPDWRSTLRKPYIVGEAGASTVGAHYEDQALNSQAVTYLLEHAHTAGVSAVLVHGEAYVTATDSLTPTGAAVALFLSQGPGVAQEAEGWNPVTDIGAALVSTARRIRRVFSG